MRSLVKRGLEAVQKAFEGGEPQEELADSVDKEGYSYLHIAAGVGDVAILEYLLDVVGMDIEGFNRRSETPLFVAAEAGNTEAVRFLLERGANVGAQTTSFQRDPDPRARFRNRNGVHRIAKDLTPLHAAALGCHVEVVRLLLESGAEVDAIDSTGNTPLLRLYRMYAIGYEESSIEAARLLLEYRANVNHVGAEFLTLLHRAVAQSNHNMACLLMEYGARADISDNKGQTAFDYALNKEDQDMVDILRGVEREPVSCTWTDDVDLVGGIAGLAAYFFMFHYGWLEGVSML